MNIVQKDTNTYNIILFFSLFDFVKVKYISQSFGIFFTVDCSLAKVRVAYRNVSSFMNYVFAKGKVIPLDVLSV